MEGQQNLKTDYQDYTYVGNKKFNLINNSDGTISLEDVTDYEIEGDDFGANDINATNQRINEMNNFIYPVGAVIINSDYSFNPNNVYGGTWELIDKEFVSAASSNLSFNAFTPNSDFITQSDDNLSCYVSKNGHCMNIEFSFKTNKAVTDSGGVLGTFNFDNLGISRFTNSMRFVGCSDGSNIDIMFYINASTGELQILDIVGADELKAGDTAYFYLTVSVNETQMLDSACDKFFWRRTA